MIFPNSFTHSQSAVSYYPSDAPPEWSAAPEKSHKWGLYNEASESEFYSAEEFCSRYPPQAPRPIPSNAVDKIKSEGARAWGFDIPETPRFKGKIQNISQNNKGRGIIRITTSSSCKDVCLLSNLPIMAGMYNPHGKQGVYYEVRILKMKSVVAIGTTCRPYPIWRLPGWNRLSAGLHLDDMRKFFEDPCGGKDYTGAPSHIRQGDVVGCAYEFATGSLFYTYNGIALPTAFTGIYVPRANFDVFAAIGIEGAAELEVNFGGDLFKWHQGNEWQWRVEGLAGQLSDINDIDEPLPSYQASTNRRL